MSTRPITLIKRNADMKSGLPHIKNLLKKTHHGLMKLSPFLYQNIVGNCIHYKEYPFPWPKFLVPRVLPYITARDNISIRRGLEVYKNLNDIDHLRNEKEADTLAILGSGPSIRELDESDYSFISSIDSLALNNWGRFHDFVPDFYKFELGSNDHHDEWINEINEKATKYSNTTFIYEPEGMFWVGQNAAETILKLDKPIRENLVEIRIFSYHHPHDKEFNNYIINMLFPRILSQRLLEFRGSLTQALALAYILDYENVILYGIDLANADYFFDDNRYRKKDGGVRHRTAQVLHGLKGIHKYVYFLNDNIFNDHGKNIYIGTENSLLYPELDHVRNFSK